MRFYSDGCSHVNRLAVGLAHISFSPSIRVEME